MNPFFQFFHFGFWFRGLWFVGTMPLSPQGNLSPRCVNNSFRFISLSLSLVSGALVRSSWSPGKTNHFPVA